jgi:hypothetical protein
MKASSRIRQSCKHGLPTCTTVSRSAFRHRGLASIHNARLASLSLPASQSSRLVGSHFLHTLPQSRSIMTKPTTGSTSTTGTPFAWDPSKFPYPSARREEHYDTYNSAKQGKQVKVLDAYRWLEEPPNKSKETEAFVQAQAELTQKYLAQDPHREALKEKLTENWNYARCKQASTEGQACLYMSS